MRHPREVLLKSIKRSQSGALSRLSHEHYNDPWFMIESYHERHESDLVPILPEPVEFDPAVDLEEYDGDYELAGLEAAPLRVAASWYDSSPDWAFYPRDYDRTARGDVA